MRRQHGQAVLFVVLVVLVLALVGLFSICTPGENDHSLGRVELISHRHRCDPDYDDCGDDRDRGGKQTCFMACYIVIPNPVPGGDQPPPKDDRPQSLVPPTPDKIIAGIQVMGDAGIKLGSTIAQLVIDYVVTVFRFLV